MLNDWETQIFAAKNGYENMSGSGLGQVWVRSGSGLGQVWVRSVSGLGQVWVRSGSGLGQVSVRSRGSAALAEGL